VLDNNGSVSSTGPVSIVYNGTSGEFDFTGTDLRVGENVVTLMVDDGNGQIVDCMFSIFVNDIFGPVINSCPQDITVTAPDGACEIPVNWTLPVISDPCDNFTFTATHNPLDNFPVGETTTVTYTAMDQSGNMTSCSFDITVDGVCDTDDEIELAISFLIDGSTFLQGQSRDGIYIVENISTIDAGTPVEVLISKTSANAMITTLDLSATSANVFGGVPADNVDWEIVAQTTGLILLRTKPGVVLQAGGSSIIVFDFNAVGLPSSTAQSTGQLINDTGGDIDINNNFAQGTFIVN